MRRRDLLRTIAGASLASIGTSMRSGRANAQGKGRGVVASYGGSYQDAQREVFFRPFERATGIEVVDVSGMGNAKIHAMAKAGNMEWDLVPAVTADVLVLAGQGMIERLDYAQIDPTVLAGIDKTLQQPYCVGSLYFSQVIAFSTKAFPAGAPRPERWVDVWDTARFPGKRMLPAGDYTVNPIEPALLADGVAPRDIYPIDFARAYKSLTRIRPAVVKWVNAGSAVPQALADGSIAVGLANAARIQDLMAQGAAVDFTWNEGILSTTNWAVLKGAPNYANAMKLIEFALRPEQQAAFAKLQPSGPTNRQAFDLIPESERRRYPSFADNMKRQVVLDAEWWAAKVDGKSNLEINSAIWSKWMLS